MNQITEEHIITEEDNPLLVTYQILESIRTDVKNNENILPIYIGFPCNSHIIDYHKKERIIHPVRRTIKELNGVMLFMNSIYSDRLQRYGIGAYDINIEPKYHVIKKWFEKIAAGLWETDQEPDPGCQRLVVPISTQDRKIIIYIDNIYSLKNIVQNDVLPVNLPVIMVKSLTSIFRS